MPPFPPRQLRGRLPNLEPISSVWQTKKWLSAQKSSSRLTRGLCWTRRTNCVCQGLEAVLPGPNEANNTEHDAVFKRNSETHTRMYNEAAAAVHHGEILSPCSYPWLKHKTSLRQLCHMQKCIVFAWEKKIHSIFLNNDFIISLIQKYRADHLKKNSFSNYFIKDPAFLSHVEKHSS